LKNLCLAYLVCIEGDTEGADLCLKQYHEADNMTDQSAALRLIVHNDLPKQDGVISDFYQRWSKEPLVVDQWLQIQASAPLDDSLARVEALMQHPSFEMTNPNKVRALVGAFCNANPVNFHRADGKGYAFLADCVLSLNKLNPQIAARLCGSMSRWRKYDQGRQELATAELKRILAEPNLSPDVYEVVSKSLA